MSCSFQVTPAQICGVFREIRRQRPLIHMLPNTVSASLCADGLSALGARPLMAVSPQEMAEITQQADGSVINLGQPDDSKLEAARMVMAEAYKLAKPLVLDPVGCGASYFRLRAVQRLLAMPWHGIVKGNRSEIYSIQQNRVTREGVDAIAKHEVSDKVACGRVYLVTGEEDAILWEGRSLRLPRDRGGRTEKDNRYNIVGTGCLLGALVGACYSVLLPALFETDDLSANPGSENVASAGNKERVTAALAASLGMAYSLEQAALAPSYGMAKYFLLDGLDALTVREFEDWLAQRAFVE